MPAAEAHLHQRRVPPRYLEQIDEPAHERVAAHDRGPAFGGRAASTAPKRRPAGRRLPSVACLVRPCLACLGSIPRESRSIHNAYNAAEICPARDGSGRGGSAPAGHGRWQCCIAIGGGDRSAGCVQPECPVPVAIAAWHRRP